MLVIDLHLEGETVDVQESRAMLNHVGGHSYSRIIMEDQVARLRLSRTLRCEQSL